MPEVVISKKKQKYSYCGRTITAQQNAERQWQTYKPQVKISKGKVQHPRTTPRYSRIEKNDHDKYLPSS